MDDSGQQGLRSKTQVPIDPQQAVQDLEELTKDPVPTLAEELAMFDALAGTQAQNGHSGMTSRQGKEGEPTNLESRKVAEQESASGVERVVEDPEIEKELEGYMEKVEKMGENPQVVLDDYVQQVFFSKKPKSDDGVVELPLTEEQVVKGLHHKVVDGLRWLAEWCVRQIKVLHGKVRFKKAETLVS